MTAGSLETPRLRLERWQPAHTNLLVRLSGTPEVMRFIGNGETWPAVFAEEVARAELRHWNDHGFGWRAAVERESGRQIGLITLNYAGEGTVGLDPGEREVGWWLEPAAWGMGYASEGAAAILDEAFDSVGAPSVVARIQPPNAGSIGVARAIGMRFEFETTGRSGELLGVYRAERLANLP